MWLGKKSNTVKQVYFCVSIVVGHCEGPTMKLFVLSTHPPPTHPPTTLSSEIESVSLWQAHALKPIHFLKAHVKSYSKTATWHKYKDNDNYKYEDEDKDKDEDAKTIPGTLTVCYIFGILMTRPVQPSTAQNSLARCSNVFKLVQMCSNLFKTCSNVFKCVQPWS